MNPGMRLGILVVLVFTPMLVTWPQASDGAAEPFKFFREYVGLNDDQINTIRSGKAVAKILDSPSADEVYVFGSVYVNSTSDRYLKFASDYRRTSQGSELSGYRKVQQSPKLSDLEGFTLEDGDIKELKKCEPGYCQVQLPSEAMDTFKQSVNWSAPDVADQVNRAAQKMALDALQRYVQGGNTALGTYRDKHQRTVVADSFQTLISRSKSLPVYLPELDRYLLAYPNANSDNIQSQFYWEKVNFGLKPTLRLVQAVVYGNKSAANPVYAVAIKQLYASHYFETALDLTVCVPDSERRGMYLITLKGSSQAGLTGLKGGIVRKVAVDKTRSSLERALETIKETLESQIH